MRNNNNNNNKLARIYMRPPQPDVMLFVPSSFYVPQVYNHNFYWKSLSPDGGGEPVGDLYDDIVESFGTYEYFMDNFTSAASGHFGSGWAWLVQKPDGCLDVSVFRVMVLFSFQKFRGSIFFVLIFFILTYFLFLFWFCPECARDAFGDLFRVWRVRRAAL